MKESKHLLLFFHKNKQISEFITGKYSIYKYIVFLRNLGFALLLYVCKMVLILCQIHFCLFQILNHLTWSHGGVKDYSTTSQNLYRTPLPLLSFITSCD
jgi:hypothetical protein